jgi:hypothetical protein
MVPGHIDSFLASAYHDRYVLGDFYTYNPGFPRILFSVRRIKLENYLLPTKDVLEGSLCMTVICTGDQFAKSHLPKGSLLSIILCRGDQLLDHLC